MFSHRIIATVVIACCFIQEAVCQDAARVEWVTEKSEFHWSRPPSIESQSDVVVAESYEFVLFPLLPTLFYAVGESSLPQRYSLFLDPSQTENFSEDTLSHTLNAYYNYLNVLGSRMRNDPSSRITITGCNSSDTSIERSVNLSRKRAEEIAGYLVAIWRIDPSRLLTQARGLPEYPADPKSKHASEENRRVEITTESWDLLKPVIAMVNMSKVYPAHTRFKFSIPTGFQPERLEIRLNDGHLWKVFNKDEIARIDSLFTWDWRNDVGGLLPGNTYITAQMFFTNGESSSIDTIRSVLINPSHWGIESGTENRREVYTLLRFNEGSAQLDKWNQRFLLEYIVPRVFSTSKVVMNAYGGDAMLSRKRTLGIISEIKKRVKFKLRDIVTHAYGDATPLYPLTYPEGRSYNRMVQVVIEQDRYAGER